MNNRFEVRGRHAVIFLETKDKQVLETKVSVGDLEKARDFIGTWYPVWSEGTQSYYVRGYGGLVNGKKKTRSLHRWIMDEPEGFVVDHINHDTLDNQYGNLRTVSHSVNSLNRKENVGVTKYKDKWKASVRFMGEERTVGYYKTREEAQRKLNEFKEEVIERNASIDEMEYEFEWFNKQVKGLL